MRQANDRAPWLDIAAEAQEHVETLELEPSHPLDTATGIVHGVLLGIVAWGVFIGFLALIFFNVHV